MPTCAVIGCSNRPEKGFSMKTFPRDSGRRLDWTKRINRQGWTPTNRSVLCEVHFAPEMWEKPRAGGVKKLKPNAIPSLWLPSKSNNTKKPFKTETNSTSPPPLFEVVYIPSTFDTVEESSSCSDISMNNVSLDNLHEERGELEKLKKENLKLIQTNKEIVHQNISYKQELQKLKKENEKLQLIIKQLKLDMDL